MSTSMSWTERANALKDRETTAWKPSDGDALAGRIRSIEKDAGQNHDSVLYTLEDEADGLWSVWGCATLDREMAKLGARMGDVVGLKFHGKRVSPKSGREYKAFTVEIFERGSGPESSDAAPVAKEKGFDDDKLPF